ATLNARIDRQTAWRRLTENATTDDGEHLWLARVDWQGPTSRTGHPRRLHASKDEETCAGTDIVVTLEDDEIGVRILVVQSRFGAWLPEGYEMMSGRLAPHPPGPPVGRTPRRHPA